MFRDYGTECLPTNVDKNPWDDLVNTSKIPLKSAIILSDEDIEIFYIDKNELSYYSYVKNQYNDAHNHFKLYLKDGTIVAVKDNAHTRKWLGINS